MSKLFAAFSTIILLGATTSHAGAEPSNGDIESGRAVYNKWCSECHNDGPAYPGTRALSVKYKGSVPAALLQRTDLSPEFIKYYVRNGFSAMPIFRKTEISAEQLRQLSLYLMQHSSKETAESK